MDVAFAALATFAEHEGGVGLGQIGHGLVTRDEFIGGVVVFLDDAALKSAAAFKFVVLAVAVAFLASGSAQDFLAKPTAIRLYLSV